MELDDNQAFVAFSRPGEEDFYLNIAEATFDVLTDENANLFDFVIMPFQSDERLNVLLKYKQSFKNKSFSFRTQNNSDNPVISKEAYLEDIINIKVSINNSNLNKVVYSRTKKLPNHNTNLGTVFLMLKEKYPRAFTFIYNIPHVGCWIGATPELLIKKKDASYKTVALAGTQRLSDDTRIEDVMWGSKEVEEQAFIKNFIKQSCDELNLDYVESKTGTIAAGGVCHIYTEYSILKVNSLAELIQRLHPGPAISGSPKDESINYIQEIEKHNRKYYTGFLGELNNNLALYINLRSMEVFNNNFLLYIGGGITSGSNPESEWLETELKAKTMEAVIK